MADYTVKDLEAAPYFDLELLMNTSQETRIGGDLMDALANAWDRWVPHARVKHVELEKGGYLVAWLDEAVEDEVDGKWEEAPSEAFMYNALAQVLCMGLVHSLLPEVEEAGCAPAPRPTDILADALEEIGVPYIEMGKPGLSRRFGVATYYPFRGGCEICMLQKDCPKAAGGDRSFSVTLSGFEEKSVKQR